MSTVPRKFSLTGRFCIQQVERITTCYHEWACISRYLKRHLYPEESIKQRQRLHSNTYHKCWKLLVMENIFACSRCSISNEPRHTSGTFQLLVHNFASFCIFELVVVLKGLCWICARGAHTDTFWSARQFPGAMCWLTHWAETSAG